MYIKLTDNIIHYPSLICKHFVKLFIKFSVTDRQYPVSVSGVVKIVSDKNYGFTAFVT